MLCFKFSRLRFNVVYIVIAYCQWACVWGCVFLDFDSIYHFQHGFSIRQKTRIIFTVIFSFSFSCFLPHRSLRSRILSVICCFSANFQAFEFSKNISRIPFFRCRYVRCLSYWMQLLKLWTLKQLNWCRFRKKKNILTTRLEMNFKIISENFFFFFCTKLTRSWEVELVNWKSWDDLFFFTLFIRKLLFSSFMQVRNWLRVGVMWKKKKQNIVRSNEVWFPFLLGFSRFLPANGGIMNIANHTNSVVTQNQNQTISQLEEIHE